jgi:KaiC/GvpD/RAD55 family RecA-like ATPase
MEEESLLPARSIGELKKQEFLWEGFIPRGEFGILSGWPGAGKSSALGGIVAAVTRAGDFIGPSGSLPGMDPGREPMAALWISCEEREERIRARIQECGADLSRVHIVRTIKEAKGERKRKRALQLPTDMERLRSWLSQTRPGIVILDSMSGLFSADYDSTKSQILNELANLAEEFGTTIILISHHTKQSAGKEANRNGPLYLAAEGSIAFAASARFQLLVAQHPEDKDLPKHDRRKVLFLAKSNEFKEGMACPFRLSSIDLPTGGSVRIPRWEAASFMDEEDFRGSASTQREKSGPAPEKMARAMEALVSFFESQGGSVESLAVQERRKELEAELGVSYGTIRDGFNRLKADGILRSDPHSSRWLFTPKPKGSQESSPLAPQSRG